MNSDIITIGDLQVNPQCSIDHIHALSEYIWKHKPRYIVNIGDTFDFESLSFYASPLEKEGKRLKDDLDAGFRAMKAIMAYVDAMNAKSRRRAYRPELHFIMGNHEHRLERFIQNHPILTGLIDIKRSIEDLGWTVHDYLVPHWIDGVCFMHFMPNPESSRAVGGGIENKLNKFRHSFVHGHQQKYQHGTRQNLEGKPHFGVCAGSFYIHDEDYRGANNTEKRGFLHLKAFTNRYNHLDHDVEFVSLERLLSGYGYEVEYGTNKQRSLSQGDGGG